MNIDTVAQALHHKSVLGDVLTPEEQQRLLRWYAEMDADEEAMYARVRERERKMLDSTRTTIDLTLDSIAATAKRIQSLELEIDRKRAEIAALDRELSQKKLKQPA